MENVEVYIYAACAITIGILLAGIVVCCFQHRYMASWNFNSSFITDRTFTLPSYTLNGLRNRLCSHDLATEELERLDKAESKSDRCAGDNTIRPKDMSASEGQLMFTTLTSTSEDHCLLATGTSTSCSGKLSESCPTLDSQNENLHANR